MTALAENGQVTLNWAGSSSAASYNIYRGTSPGSETLYQSDVTSTSFVDSSAANGTTYYYEVSAVSRAGEGVRSSEESATPTSSGLPSG